MAIGVVVLTKSPKDGTDAVLYNIVPSSESITYNVNTAVSTPSFITVKLKKTVGSAVTYPSVLPEGVTVWYKLDTEVSYAQVANNGYVYQDGWGTAGQIEVYLTKNNSAPDSTKSNVISSITIPFINTGINGQNGDNAFNIYLAPSTIAIGDKSDGTLDLSTAKASIVGKYGSNAATISLNGSLILTNCKASFDSTTKIISITEVLKQDVTYIYDGTQYTTLAYCPNGYILMPVTVTYGSKSISITLRLDFTVSGYISIQENNLQVAKVITDNNQIKVDVATISQKGDDICLSISESYMDTLEKNGSGVISVFDVTGNSLYQYQDGNFLQMQGNNASHIVVLGKSITGLTVGIEYTVHFLIKQNAGDGPINLFAGNTAGGINAMVCDLTGADEIGTYKDYGGFKDIVGTFKATAMTMIVGFKITLNDVDSYLDIDVNGFTIGYDITSKLLVTGIDIKNRKIVATADSFVIQDNQGHVNAIFETGEDGMPYLKAQYIKTTDLDISGTFSERYSFVERGTFNKIDFTTKNNIAVSRGVDNTPAVITLPLYEAYAGGNFSTAAYTKAGTNVSIQNSYNPNMKNWKEAAYLLNGSGKSELRYQLAASSVIIVSDPRIIAYNNYLGTTPLIYPDGSVNVNDSIEYRKGRMFCNGKSARMAMILPGQTLRLQSAIEYKGGLPYLVWYVVNAAEFTSINKYIYFQKNANNMFPLNTGDLAFKASNTYSNWGDSSTYDTECLIAPKELDAFLTGQTYSTEEPDIVIELGFNNTIPTFYIS